MPKGSDKPEEKIEISITVCLFCAKENCECKFLICPFHGKVNAKEDGEIFRCPIKNCEIKRTKKELES